MKNIKLFLFFFFLIFAISFAVPVIMFLPNLLEISELTKIAETGTKTTAEVVTGSWEGSITINNIDYYSVQYEFEDEHGNKHYGRTTERYTYNETVWLDFIDIKYDPETYMSVEADYNYKSDPEVTISFIFVIVFGIVDVGFWITEIVFIVQFIKQGIVSLRGEEFTAKFISIKPGVVYNGTPLYSILYSWTNELGQVCEGQSGECYTLNEAHAFELAGKFKILGFRELSKIVSKPSKLLHKQEKAENVTMDNYYVCPYCKSMLSVNTTKCPSCGAPRKHKTN